MSYPLHVYHPNTQGRPVICIGHGNGFPPLAYQPLAHALGKAYHTVCLPARPWWDADGYKRFRNWHTLGDDLIGGLQEHGLGPVIGVGHSMSGVAMVYAAVQAPHLFKAIILVDPVYLPPWIARLERIMALFGKTGNNAMVQGALKRRREWPSLEDAFQRFRGRSLFARCSDEVLRLYTEGITRPKADGGIELAYPPEWEACIFGTPPYDEWGYPRRISIPTLIIGGEETDVFTEASVKAWRRLRPDIEVRQVPQTGHLLPLEQPEVLANHIQGFVSGLAS